MERRIEGRDELRVAFVLQTLLCLLRLYNNKSGNVGSIAVLRSILDVRMRSWDVE